MEIQVIKEKVKIPKSMYRPGSGRRPENPATLALIDWLDTENKTLRLRCANPAECKTVYATVFRYKKRHDLDFTIYKRGLEIYLIKA